ncbi:MAG: signal recognition particle protein [Pseudomonadota bacterium]|nr:signal recognition particle protein [Pseudomonadota bacterium]
MFEGLQNKLLTSLKKLSGQSKISEKNIDETLREIRLALLEADVNFKVVKIFLDQVKAKALGAEVLGSLSAGQAFTKIVHDELISLLGNETPELDVRGEPGLIFLVGLQGAGKTTSAAKLAQFIRKKFSKRPGLVPADVYRPAAIEQLKTLGKQLDVPVFDSKATDKPEDILERAKVWAKQEMIDVLILDTAGRLQIDVTLMKELSRLKAMAAPKEILLVVDAMLGQESVNVAEGFNKELGITGLVLTKIDGDARGGAALSIRHTTGIPIKFLGIGEKLSDFEVFHPDRLASRILDMGDVLSLVEKAQEFVDEKSAMEQAKRLAKSKFTMNDFLSQIQMMKKMGGMGSILKMLPGAGQMMKKMEDMTVPDKEIKKVEAIIHSMTPKERANHKILNGSRRKRIAQGSGTQPSDINKFITQFEQAQKMMSQVMKMGFGRGGMKLPF